MNRPAWVGPDVVTVEYGRCRRPRGGVTGLMAPQAERPYPPERAVSVPISLNGYA